MFKPPQFCPSYIKKTREKRSTYCNPHLSFLSELHRSTETGRATPTARHCFQFFLSCISNLPFSIKQALTWLSILSELHLNKVSSGEAGVRPSLSILSELHLQTHLFQPLVLFVAFNSFWVASIKIQKRKDCLGRPFNSFWVASELFYSGGVYMFNV